MTTTEAEDRTEEVVFELLLIRVCLEREEGRGVICRVSR